MSYEQPVGSVFVSPVQRIAAKCADAIMEFQSARAVTMDPEGRVFVESVAHAAETDIVGVYGRGIGILDLTRSIREDLLHEKSERGLVKRARRTRAGALA